MQPPGHQSGANDKLMRHSPQRDVYAIGIFRNTARPVNHQNHVVLVNRGDMGNLGTSSALWPASASRTSPWSSLLRHLRPRVVRSSWARFSRCPLNTSMLSKTIGVPQSSRIPFMPDGAHPAARGHLHSPIGVFFGNIGRPATLYKEIGTSIFIPHTDRIDSLNLPIAAGIALY